MPDYGNGGDGDGHGDGNNGGPLPVHLRSRASFSETALAWIQRTQRRRALLGVPRDPAGAAWSFLRPTSRTGGTGLAFLDAALRRPSQSSAPPWPVVELRGTRGKSSTLLTLAARFVVATRPSQFEATPHGRPTPPLPMVILLDSTGDMTVGHLAHVVRSTLLRCGGEPTDANGWQDELEECLGRIQVGYVTQALEGVALLETLRARLATTQSEHPTLLLWDGYLDTFYDETSRMEVVRQMARLLRDCSVPFVYAASTLRRGWDKYVTHRIRLEADPSEAGPTVGVATVHGTRIPFSISSAGVLS